MLDSIFERLGLSKKEAFIYLTLLESGATTAGSLVKRTNLPRSSLYGYLNTLHQHGLVNLGEQHGTQLWQAESPNKLYSIIEKQTTEWSKATNELKDVLPELIAKQNTDFLSPGFTYYEGVEGVKHILKDMLLYRDISTQAFWPIKEMLEILGKDFFYEHNVQRIRQNISVQALWPVEKAVDLSQHIFLGVGQAFKREIRIAPKEIQCTMGYWSYHNKIAFLSSKKECFGFIVESNELKQMLGTQFEFIWTLSKNVKPATDQTKKFINDNF